MNKETITLELTVDEAKMIKSTLYFIMCDTVGIGDDDLNTIVESMKIIDRQIDKSKQGDK